MTISKDADALAVGRHPVDPSPLSGPRAPGSRVTDSPDADGPAVRSRSSAAAKAAVKARDAFSHAVDVEAPDVTLNMHLLAEDGGTPAFIPDCLKVSLDRAIDQIVGKAESYYSVKTVAAWRGVARLALSKDARFKARGFDGSAPTAARAEKARTTADPFETEIQGGTQWTDASGSDVELFASNGGMAAHVMQLGYLGDCYLMAALAGIAAADPEALEGIISGPNADGSYDVTFHEPVPQLTIDGVTYNVVRNAQGRWELQQLDGTPAPGNLGFDLSKFSVTDKGLAVYDFYGPDSQIVEFGVGAEVTVNVPAEVLTDAAGDAVGAGLTDFDGDGKLEIGVNIIEHAFMKLMAQTNEELGGLFGTWANPSGQVHAYGLFGLDVNLDGSLEGYENIVGGFIDWATEILTGNESYWDGDVANADPDNLFARLSAANDGETVLAGTSGSDQDTVDGIVQGHAYTVLGTVEIDGQRYVILRNPYGCMEADHDPPNVYNGVDDDGGAEDGIFMMTLEQFQGSFTTATGPVDATGAPITGSPKSATDVGSTGMGDLGSVLAHYWAVCTNQVVTAPPPPPAPPPSDSDGVPPSVPPNAPSDGGEVPDPGLVDVVSGGVDGLAGRWRDYLIEADLTGHIDINALVQWVLREAYMENMADLRFYAEKVRFYNNLKKMIRAEISAARDHLSDALDINPSLKSEDPLPNGAVMGVVEVPKGAQQNEDGQYQPIAFRNADGSIAAGVESKAYTTKQGLDSYIEKLEEELNSVGDDAQLANVDLQNMMQRQQQTLQLLSNTSKMLHDTAMAIIRKIGG